MRSQASIATAARSSAPVAHGQTTDAEAFRETWRFDLSGWHLPGWTCPGMKSCSPGCDPEASTRPLVGYTVRYCSSSFSFLSCRSSRQPGTFGRCRRCRRVLRARLAMAAPEVYPVISNAVADAVKCLDAPSRGKWGDRPAFKSALVRVSPSPPAEIFPPSVVISSCITIPIGPRDTPEFLSPMAGVGSQPPTAPDDILTAVEVTFTTPWTRMCC